MGGRSLPVGLVVGLVYDVFGSYPPRPGEPPDAEAEYEPEATVEALEAALARLGHRPLRLGNAHTLLAAAGAGKLPPLDAALCIAEGYGTRNREAWGPVLLDMLGIPALGSDPLTLSLSLDKAWTKDVVGAVGVPVVPHLSLETAAQLEGAALPGPFPLFVKPRWEGTAKGIGAGSRVEDRAALAERVAWVVERYQEPALVEPFLPGAEYTVTLVGNDPPDALPVLQRALEARTGIGLHAVAASSPPGAALAHATPGGLDAALEARLGELARRAFAALRCRDFARVDFKLDAAGRPWFLEINPLPTFAPEGSFGILAELAGRPLADLLADVLRRALARVRPT
jgi:D-alanine-D-alanine ligase